MRLVQMELVIHALRTPGLEGLADWQYEQYTAVVAAWCEEAAMRPARRLQSATKPSPD